MENVGTPRFYIDHLLWLKSHGILEATSEGVEYVTGSPLEMISLNPSNQYKLFAHNTFRDDSYTDYPQAPQILDSDGNIKNYIAVLGHNAASAGASIHVADPNNSVGAWSARPLVNYEYGIPTYDGFTIATNIDFGDEGIRIHSLAGTATADHYVGCYSHGNYYDMPHSPDLSLTMTREMDGVKRIRTKGGADLVKHQYTKPPLWGESAAAWELHTGTTSNQSLSRSGRRVWDLSFSYLSSSDVFPDVSNLNNYQTSGWDDQSDPTLNTLLDSNNLYSQVIHKTNGGQLRFIFQPNSNDNSPNGFAIAKFDQSSFSFQQTAPNLYSCKMKIREVW